MTAPDAAPRMTKGERQELGQLIRKRERVMKAAAAERAAAMIADFERQCAAIYFFNDDKIWAEAHALAESAVKEAQDKIAARCADLGIPTEFAPGLNLYWQGRGQNALKDRQQELRRVAKTKITAIEAGAVVKIERQSLEAQTQVLTLGLESEAARNFLEHMPSVEALMPTIDAVEIKTIVDARRAQRRDYDP